MSNLRMESNVCRVCLSSDNDKEWIFCTSRNDDLSIDEFDIPMKLRLCGGVEVIENDGLPDHICTKCISKVNAAHELRELCQKSDMKLRELYGKTIKRIDRPTVAVHRYCQTDTFIPFNSVKVEDNVISELESDNANERKPAFEYDTSIDGDDKHNLETNDRKLEHDVSIKRENYRSRRKNMFKQVTSMESLKNHKEIQRKYIKKYTNSKHESVEREMECDRLSVTRSGTVHECPICNKYCCSKRALNGHVSEHGSKKLNCQKCKKYFFRLDKLLEHGELHKKTQRSEYAQCQICQKNFRKTETMVRHLNAHKKTNPREVFSILKEIREKRKLEDHAIAFSEYDTKTLEITANDVSDYKPDDTNLAQNSNTILHIENTTNKTKKVVSNQTNISLDAETSNSDRNDLPENTLPHRCTHCGKSYASEKSLQRHTASIHDEKQLVCKVCKMRFFRRDRLESHRDRYGHREEDASPVDSEKVPPDDKSAIKLINNWIREELGSNNEGKGFSCKICGKSYDNKKSLLKHQTSTHETENEEYQTEKNHEENHGMDNPKKEKKNKKEEKYSCDECEKSFEKEMKLRRHKRIHERNVKERQDASFKRFLCHVCSKTFRQNTGLMFHMRTHTGYKPHVCKYCGRGFTSNSNCINHERTHTGDRPFVCHFCSAAFAKSCTLKAHITTHTGEANYHCKTCGKSFRRLKYLKEHRFTHTGEKPYACKICGTAYSHSGSLFVHEKKCKAQYGNYQNISTRNTTNYWQRSESTNTGNGSLIVGVLNNGNDTLDTRVDKNYTDNSHRIINSNTTIGTLETSDHDVHINHPDNPDVASTVRNFAVIGQMFQS